MQIRLKPRFFIFLAIFAYGIFALWYLINTKKSVPELKAPGGEKAKIVIESSGISQDSILKLKEAYKNKMTFIFFYDGYKNQKQALSFVQLLKQTLFILEPFKSLSKYLVYKTFTTDSQKCIVKNNILVCDVQLIESFKKLGIDYFKLVIISPLEFKSSAEIARGKNSWITISTFKKGLPEEEFNRFLGAEFAQNLGYAMGLSPENASSASAQLDKVTSKKPNCAPTLEDAKAWWGSYTLLFDTVGYYYGCGGSASSVYPEKGTIMSDNPEKESYGVVSEDYLRGVIQCFYGNKESSIFEAKLSATLSATLNSCVSFKQQFPDFWKE